MSIILTGGGGNALIIPSDNIIQEFVSAVKDIKTEIFNYENLTGKTLYLSAINVESNAQSLLYVYIDRPGKLRGC